MPEYRYTAINKDGYPVKGIIVAEDKAAFFEEIKKQHHHLKDYSLNEKSALNMDLGKNAKLPLKDVTMFCRQMASLLRVGVSLVKALDILYQQSTNKKLKSCTKELFETVQKGSQLSAGLRKQANKWPEMMMNMVESGEASGSIDTTMEKLADQFESDLKVKNKVKSALAYPVILVVLAIGVVLLMVIAVLPQFVSMFESAGIEKLPLPTQIIMDTSKFITTKWYILIVVIGVVAVSFRTWVKTPKGKYIWDKLKFKLPIAKDIMSKLVVVRFARTFSTLFSSGMSILSSMSIVMNVVNNQFVHDQLVEVSDDIRRGLSLTQSIRRVSVFPPLVHSMISVGEESGSLDTMLKNSADYFNEELENAITRMVTLIEPIMIVGIAGMVGFIILSIMLPMMQIYQNVS